MNHSVEGQEARLGWYWVLVGKERTDTLRKRILKGKMERTAKDNIQLFHSVIHVAPFYILLFFYSKRIVPVLFIIGCTCVTGKVSLWFNVFSKLRIPVKKNQLIMYLLLLRSFCFTSYIMTYSEVGQKNVKPGSLICYSLISWRFYQRTLLFLLVLNQPNLGF